jgi:hypothetical protein
LYDPIHTEPKHGHEYFLEVSVHAGTGLDKLEEVVRSRVVEPWNMKDWSKMGLRQASGELLVEEFDSILRKSEIGPNLVGIQLKETRKNRFLSSASSLNVW